MKNLPVRFKFVILYVNMTIFTIPALIISYLSMARLDQMPQGTGAGILTGFLWGYPIFIAVYLFVTILLGRMLTKAIAFPIRRLADASAALAKGDNNIPLDYEATDEIGVLYHNFRNMVLEIEQQTTTLRSIAQGNYTLTLASRSSADVLNQSIQEILDKNNSMLISIRNAAGQVSAGATQISDGAQALSQGATEQASAIEQLSAAISEVYSQTRANTKTADSALVVVNEAGQQMGEAVEYMHQMEQAMRGISTSSEEISKIIKVIDDIAFQTNILALNAAVEAARAGQHGKGFAVVADEVRNLASKSAEAAKETSSLIQKSLDHVESGSDIVTKTGRSIGQVSLSAQKTQAMIHEINTASQQQEDAIRQINTGIEQVSQVIQTNSATAEESAAASEELAAQAQMLGDIVSRFQLKAAGSANLPELDLDSIIRESRSYDFLTLPSPQANDSKYN